MKIRFHALLRMVFDIAITASRFGRVTPGRNSPWYPPTGEQDEWVPLRNDLDALRKKKKIYIYSFLSKIEPRLVGRPARRLVSVALLRILTINNLTVC